MGSQGLAYYDTEYGNYGSSGGTTVWNRGWVFRNDGVDISSDHSGEAIQTDTLLGMFVKENG